MSDIVNDICKYIDTKEIDLNVFLNKFDEKYIVDAFIKDVDKIKFRFNHFMNLIDVDQFALIVI